MSGKKNSEASLKPVSAAQRHGVNWREQTVSFSTPASISEHKKDECSVLLIPLKSILPGKNAQDKIDGCL